MKTIFKSEKPKNGFILTIQIFLSNVLRMILCSAFVKENMNTQISRKKIIDAINKHVPKKIKLRYFKAIKNLM